MRPRRFIGGPSTPRYGLVPASSPKASHMKHQMRMIATLSLLLPLAASAAVPLPREDLQLARELLRDGVETEAAHVVVHAEADELTADERRAFADLADATVQAIRDTLGDALDMAGGNDGKVVFFIDDAAGMSHAVRGEMPYVYITAERIRDRTAPYAHEAAHVLAVWSQRAGWLSEGLANHLAATAVARVGGYRHEPLRTGGLEHAKAHAHSKIGWRVLQLIGKTAERGHVEREHAAMFERIDRERQTWAAAYYSLAWSFVDFLQARVGLDGLRDIFSADDIDAAARRRGGAGIDELKQQWLDGLRGPRTADPPPTTLRRPDPALSPP